MEDPNISILKMGRVKLIPEVSLTKLFLPYEKQEALVEEALEKFFNHINKDLDKFKQEKPQLIRSLKNLLRCKINVIGLRNSNEYYATLKFTYKELDKMVCFFKGKGI